MPTLVYSAQNSNLQSLGQDKGRTKRRKCLVWGMNCEAEQETGLSISFQWDSGEQEPVHRAGGQKNQVDVSLLQMLETLLCRGTNSQAGRVRSWGHFTGLWIMADRGSWMTIAEFRVHSSELWPRKQSEGRCRAAVGTTMWVWAGAAPRARAPVLHHHYAGIFEKLP